MRHHTTWIAGVILLSIIFFTWLSPPLSLDGLDCDEGSDEGLFKTLQTENARLLTSLERMVNRSRPDLDRATECRSPYATPDAFAYVFYATSDDYACSVLVNIYRLRESMRTHLPIHVLISRDVSARFVQALRERGAFVHVEEPPKLKNTNVGYYQGCLLKLLAFKMHLLQPGLERVLVLDADQLIMKNLDYLFTGLPVVDLAAPRAYWLDDNFMSSTFMMITLSDRLWHHVNEGIEHIQADQYDMDLVNALLGHAALILPGHFVTVNSHWEDWNLPKWYQVGGNMPQVPSTATGDGHRVFEASVSGIKQKRQLADVVSTSGVDTSQAQLTIEQQIAALGQPQSGDSTSSESVSLSLHDAQDSASASSAPDSSDSASSSATSSDASTHDASPGIPEEELARILADLNATPPPSNAEQPQSNPAQTPLQNLEIDLTTVPLGAPLSPLSPDHPLHRELYALQDAAAVIHFFAAGKPWSYTTETLKQRRPDAHPLLYKQFESWNAIAKYVCPVMQH